AGGFGILLFTHTTTTHNLFSYLVLGILLSSLLILWRNTLLLEACTILIAGVIPMFVPPVKPEYILVPMLLMLAVLLVTAKYRHDQSKRNQQPGTLENETDAHDLLDV